MNYHILLKDGKAWAVDVPKDVREPTAFEVWLNRLQKAKDNAVPFKDYRKEYFWLYSLKDGSIIQCPDGYRIEIERITKGREARFTRKVAVLKPVKR